MRMSKYRMLIIKPWITQGSVTVRWCWELASATCSHCQGLNTTELSSPPVHHTMINVKCCLLISIKRAGHKPGPENYKSPRWISSWYLADIHRMGRVTRLSGRAKNFSQITNQLISSALLNLLIGRRENLQNAKKSNNFAVIHSLICRKLLGPLLNITVIGPLLMRSADLIRWISAGGIYNFQALISIFKKMLFYDMGIVL